MCYKAPDELDLHALVDGQLNGEDTKRVFKHLSLNPALLQKYWQLEQQKKMLQLWAGAGMDDEE